MNITDNFFSTMELQNYALWIIVTYGAVTLAMAVDFITGIRRAKKAKIATRSRGYKMTCTKAAKYFLPMLCLTCIDLIGAIILPCPAFTMIMAAFNIFCEWKSVMETTHDKEEIREAESTFNVIIKNKDDIAKLISELLKNQLNDEKNN